MSVAAVNERLAAITAAGTSIWLDQLRRSMTLSWELGRMIEEDSLRGVTSNPAIFEKAILGSTDYDEQIAELAGEGLDARRIYEEIAITDVRLACDVPVPEVLTVAQPPSRTAPSAAASIQFIANAFEARLIGRQSPRRGVREGPVRILPGPIADARCTRPSPAPPRPPEPSMSSPRRSATSATCRRARWKR